MQFQSFADTRTIHPRHIPEEHDRNRPYETPLIEVASWDQKYSRLPVPLLFVAGLCGPLMIKRSLFNRVPVVSRLTA